MKRILRKYMELGLVWFVVLSPGLALCINWTSDSFDLVREPGAMDHHGSLKCCGYITMPDHFGGMQNAPPMEKKMAGL